MSLFITNQIKVDTSTNTNSKSNLDEDSLYLQIVKWVHLDEDSLSFQIVKWVHLAFAKMRQFANGIYNSPNSVKLGSYYIKNEIQIYP